MRIQRENRRHVIALFFVVGNIYPSLKNDNALLFPTFWPTIPLIATTNVIIIIVIFFLPFCSFSDFSLFFHIIFFSRFFLLHVFYRYLRLAMPGAWLDWLRWQAWMRWSWDGQRRHPPIDGQMDGRMEWEWEWAWKHADRRRGCIIMTAICNQSAEQRNRRLPQKAYSFHPTRNRWPNGAFVSWPKLVGQRGVFFAILSSRHQHRVSKTSHFYLFKYLLQTLADFNNF